jgi:antitoxin MazE
MVLTCFEGVVMSSVMKLRKIGGSVGIIIPKDELDRMNLTEGDELHGVADGHGIYLQPYDPDFQQKLKAFERTRKRYRNALRELAN